MLMTDDFFLNGGEGDDAGDRCPLLPVPSFLSFPSIHIATENHSESPPAHSWGLIGRPV